MERNRFSRSRISVMLVRVLFVHYELLVKSSSVMHLMVRGMNVNEDTTSKDTMVSSGSTETSLIY